MRLLRRSGGARFTGDHHQIRNPNQHLKIGFHDVKVRPVIVCVHTQAHSGKAVKGRHPVSLSVVRLSQFSA